MKFFYILIALIVFNISLAQTSDDILADSLTIELVQIDTSFSVDSDVTIKAEVLSGTSPFTYRWSNQPNYASNSDTQRGKHGKFFTVTVTSALGCTSVSSITITANIPSFSMYSIGDTLFCENKTSFPVIDFEWDFGDGQKSLDANPSHIFQNSGIYKVCLEAEVHSCVVQHCEWIQVGNRNCLHTQSPKPLGNLVKDIAFLAPELGWAVGEKATILRSKNSGQSWERVATNFSEDLNRVFVLDSLNIWACGNDGLIVKSEDGGTSWEKSHSLYGYFFDLNDINFSGKNHGYAVCDGYILSTKDGGDTWSYFQNSTDVNCVFFQDSLIGWAGNRNGQLMHTKDGGISWELQETEMSNDINTFHFYDHQNWIIGGNSSSTQIYKSYDGGQTWKPKVNLNQITIYNLCVIKENTWAVGSKGTILRSSDSGDTWEKQQSNTLKDLVSINFIDSLNGFALGNENSGGLVLSTKDGGATWQSNYNPTNRILDVFAVDSATIFTTNLEGKAPMLKSLNGGETWIDVSIPTLNVTGGYWPLKSSFWVSNKTGWVVGKSGLIYKTTDGGNSWEAQHVDNNFKLECVTFVDSLNGWIGGKDVIFKTTDSGKHWKKYNLSALPSGIVRSFHFLDKLNGWATFEGYLLKTIDGGDSWQSIPLYTETYSALYDVIFLDNYHGWAVGNNWYREDGVIFYTKDGGNTFTKQYRKDNEAVWPLTRVHFQDTLQGWALTSRGIVRTKDGGQNWYTEYWNETERMIDFHFLPSSEYWIVGNENLILHAASTAAPIVSDVQYCQNANANQLVAIGSNLIWHDQPIGGIGSTIAPIPNTKIVGQQTWYVSSGADIAINCHEPLRVPITVTILPELPAIEITIDTSSAMPIYIFGQTYTSDTTIIHSVKYLNHPCDSLIQHINIHIQTTATSEKEDNFGIQLYPNPAQNKIQVNWKTGEVKLSIFDTKGRILLEKIGFSGLELDLSAFSDGVYFLKMDGGDGSVFYRKIVVQR